MYNVPVILGRKLVIFFFALEQNQQNRNVTEIIFTNNNFVRDCLAKCNITAKIVYLKAEKNDIVMYSTYSLGKCPVKYNGNI